MAQHEVYSSPKLRAFAVVAPNSDRQRIIVAFANWLGAPALTAHGAAQGLLGPRGIDAIYLNCAGNHWWQYEDLWSAIGAIRQFVAPWREVVTYGSSMGGYAAFRYAVALGARRAVASCPQFSIQRTMMPLENRWGDELAAITFQHETFFMPAPGCKYLAIYDPLFRLDAMHVNEFRRHVPVVDVPLTCSGHPPLELLQAYGTVSRITLELLSDTYQPALARAEHRAKRRETSHYWCELAARLQERRHYAAMLRACEKSADLSPTKPILQRIVNICAAAGLTEPMTHYRERLEKIAGKAAA